MCIRDSGKPVVLKIAPADPRSLMQGDYMVLNYAILSELQQSQFSSESNESNAPKRSALSLGRTCA